MQTYLLTWNPEMWPWDDLANVLERVQRRGEETFEWSTGNTRRIQGGDRLFLLKQGAGVRGIFGAGTAISSVHDAPHYDAGRRAAGEMATFVTCRCNLLLDPQREDLLTTEELEDALPEVHWTPAASGCSVAEAAAERLERLWRQHVDRVRR